jgi:hypothetical protein
LRLDGRLIRKLPPKVEAAKKPDQDFGRIGVVLTGSKTDFYG